MICALVAIGVTAFMLAFGFWPEIHEVVWRRWIRRLEPEDMSTWV